RPLVRKVFLIFLYLTKAKALGCSRLRQTNSSSKEHRTAALPSPATQRTNSPSEEHRTAAPPCCDEKVHMETLILKQRPHPQNII
ncbi:hypothetical protein GLOIN_2v1510197, partial [Rhizophagus irregularis DAOM 181602=DAOM 197198]